MRCLFSNAIYLYFICDVYDEGPWSGGSERHGFETSKTCPTLVLLVCVTAGLLLTARFHGREGWFKGVLRRAFRIVPLGPWGSRGICRGNRSTAADQSLASKSIAPSARSNQKSYW